MNFKTTNQMPESWVNDALKRILAEQLQPGFAQNPKDGGDVGQIRTHNVSPDGRIDLTGIKFVFPSEKEFKKYTLRKGDIVFNNTNSDEWVGKTALYDQDEEYLFSNHMTRIRVDQSITEPEYIAKYLHFLWLRGYSRRKSKQWVNQSGIQQSTLENFPIPLPPLELQNTFAEKVQAIEETTQAIEKSLQKIETLYDTLLQQAFNGGLTEKWSPSTGSG